MSTRRLSPRFQTRYTSLGHILDTRGTAGGGGGHGGHRRSFPKAPSRAPESQAVGPHSPQLLNSHFIST